MADVIVALWGSAFLARSADISSGGAFTFKNLLVWEGEVALHFLPQLLHTLSQQAWIPSSRWVSLLHPILEGMGICHCLFSLHLSIVLAGKGRIGRWLEILSEETQWCRGGLMVILHLVYLTCPFGMVKQGPHLPCQIFAVCHPWYCQQLSPPIRCFANFQLSKPPTCRALSLGIWERMPFLLSLSPQLTLWGRRQPLAPIPVAPPCQGLW